MKKIVANTMLVCISVVISFVAVEFLLRLTDYKALLRFHIYGVPPYYYESDAVLGADIARGFPDGTHEFSDGSYPVFSNSYGCFDRSQGVKGDYILLVGDSTAWGYARYEKKWGTRLEELLGHQVLKCGVSGTGTLFQLRKAAKIIDQIGRSPSLIIVGYSRNDLNDDAVFPDTTVIEGYRVSRVKKIDVASGAIEHFTADALEKQTSKYIIGSDASLGVVESLRQFVKNNSIVANLIWRLVKHSHLRSGFGDKATVRKVYELDLRKMRAQGVEWAERVWQKHLSAIVSFQEFAEKHGAALVLVASPHKSESVAVMADSLAFLNKRGIAHVSVGKEAERFLGDQNAEAIFWRFNPHLNEAGNEFTALIVGKFLIERNFAACTAGAECETLDSRLASFREGLGH